MLIDMKPIRTLACLLLMAPALALGAAPVSAAKESNGTPPAATPNGAPNGAPKASTPAAKPSLSTQELKGRVNALQQYFTEDEWKQVSNYLLDSAIDGLKGTEDATLAPDLAFRLEILKRRMTVEGNTLMDELSAQWQQLMTPPPPVPYEPRPLPAWATPVYTPPSPAVR